MLLLFFIGLVIYHIIKYIIPHFTPKNDVSAFWTDIEALTNDKPLANSTIFKIHKGPKKLRYVLKTPIIRSILEDLSFILKYDQDLYCDIVIYVEYFLKYHLNVMIGKYDPCTYISIIRDIYTMTLNRLSTCTYTLPKVSTIVDIPDLDVFMVRKSRDLQAVMYKYIYVLRHKFPQCQNATVNPHDTSYDPNMMY